MHHSNQYSSGFVHRPLGILTAFGHTSNYDTAFRNMVSCHSTKPILDEKLNSAVDGSCNTLSRNMIADAANHFGRNTISDAAKVTAPAVFRLRVDEGFGDSPILGSGFLVDKSGLIITCFHNIVTNPEAPKFADKHKVTVTLSGREYEGKVTVFDHDYDLAVVKIDLADSDSVSPAKLGVSSEVQLAEFVISPGYSADFPTSSLSVFARGIVSRTYYQASARDQQSLYFQTDFATLKGTIGSPLVNLNGEVVGIMVGENPDAHIASLVLAIDIVRQRLSLKGCVV